MARVFPVVITFEIYRCVGRDLQFCYVDIFAGTPSWKFLAIVALPYHTYPGIRQIYPTQILLRILDYWFAFFRAQHSELYCLSRTWFRNIAGEPSVCFKHTSPAASLLGTFICQLEWDKELHHLSAQM